VLDTFRLVENKYGIENVSKLNVMFDAFDVNPAVKMFVVVTAFDTYRFPVIFADAFARVMVFANRLVVVRAFDTYRFPVILADAFARVMVFANRLVVVRAFDAYTFPETHRVGPDAGGADAVPIPTCCA